MVSKANRLRAIERQIERLTGELGPLHKRSNRLGWLRVLLFGALFVGSSIGFYWRGPWLAAALLVGLGALFAALILLHQRVEEAITRRLLWRRWKQMQVARATLDWSQIPLATEAQPDYAHPFEADLDVVAERADDISLHRLLDVSTTLGGSRRLRQWLTAVEVDVEAVLSRQRLVRELMPRFWLRSRLFVDAKWAGASADSADVEAVVESKLDTDSLLNWLASDPPDSQLRGWLIGLSGFSVVNWGLLLLVLLGTIPFWGWAAALCHLLGAADELVAQ